MKINSIIILLGVLVIAYLFVAYDYLFGQTAIVDDPLTNSQTVGSRHEGTFSSGGWKTTDELSYIQYNIPTISSGVVEFDVKGIYASNQVFPNCDIDKYGNKNCAEEDIHYQLINFWDRDDNNSWWGTRQWHNPEKMIIHLYGYVAGDIYKWKYIEHRLNVCATTSGYEDDEHALSTFCGPFDWQKDTVYHHKLTWGNGHFKWYMNDILITDNDYSSFGCEYAPPFFSIRLGSAILGGVKSGGLKCPVGITYSNFKVYELVDTTLPEVVESETTKEEGKTSVTSDILITFNKPMNPESIRQNLVVYPDFPYDVQLKGNTVCVRNTNVLQSNTFYSVTLKENTADLSGNKLGHSYIYAFQTNQAFPDTLYLYKSHDFPLTISNINYNTQFTGTFINETQTITLDGFWDGYSIGKVRFTPDRVGVWNYNINGTIGTFICIDSNLQGFIKTDGTKFKWTNGKEFHWIGNTVWRGYTNLMSYNSRWKEIINLCRDHNYTVVQSIVHSYINGNAFWANEGGKCFSGEEPNYDNLNPEYFRWMDRRINYSLDNKIIPVIFCSWTQDYGNFSESQWRKYLSYLIARYSAKNIIWIICGEYNELPNDFTGRTTEEFNTWGALIKQKDPYKHPVSLHPTGRTSSAEFATKSWMDFIGQQTPYADVDIRRDLVYGKPVVNLETSYYYPLEYGAAITNEQVREQLYKIAKAGGYYTAGFYTYYAPDKSTYNLSLLSNEQLWTKQLNKFILSGTLPNTYEEYVQSLTDEQIDNQTPTKVRNVRIVK